MKGHISFHYFCIKSNY